MRVLASILASLLIVASTASAQGTTSRVTGVVTDRTGSVVPGATVTLTNESTGIALTAVSNATGGYSFEAVQVGTYTVTPGVQALHLHRQPGPDR